MDFQGPRIASTNDLSWECTWHVLGTARSKGNKPREQERRHRDSGDPRMQSLVGHVRAVAWTLSDRRNHPKSGAKI